MKKLVILWALLVSVSLAQTTVRLAGFEGDANGMAALLDEVVNPALAADGIVAVFEPVPDFQVQLTKGLSAGTAADLFFVDIVWSEGTFNTGKVVTLDGVDTSAFLPNLMDAFTLDGKVYGVPKDFNTLALEYNKDIFDEAGVDYPNADDTWDTLKEKLVAIQSSLEDTYGMCVLPDMARFGAFAFATGWQPFNEEGHTDLDDNFRRAFEFYTSLVADGAGVTQDVVGSPGWGGGCFATDKIAATLEGGWVTGFLRDQAPNLEYGTTFLPKDPVSGQRGNYIFTVSWSINSGADQEAAMKVLEALTSEEAQQFVLEKGLAIPSRAALGDNPFFSAEGKDAENKRVVFEGASDGNVLPYKFKGYGDEWTGIINDALSGVLLGERTVDEALSEAQLRFDELTGR
jgi:multiple sugar transport system substrate-binding protein